MQDLNKFKNEMNLSGQNVYVGHRYVPKIMGDWDKTQIYEPLSIVQYQGNSFTSRQYVPTGVEITNEEFWASTGNYNAQVEQYRQDVRNLENDINNVNNEVIEARQPMDGVAYDTLSERLDNMTNVVNVSDFGAYGANTLGDRKDESDEINAAITYALQNGYRAVYFPNNYYLMTKKMVKIYGRLDLHGVESQSQITYQAQEDGYFVEVSNISVSFKDLKLTIENNGFDANGMEVYRDTRKTWGGRVRLYNVDITGYQNVGLKVYAPYNLFCEKVFINGPGDIGVLTGTNPPVTKRRGVILTGYDTDVELDVFGNVNRFVDCRINRNRIGVELINVGSTVFDTVTFEGNWVHIYAPESEGSTLAHRTKNKATNAWFENSVTNTAHPESSVLITGLLNEETGAITYNRPLNIDRFALEQTHIHSSNSLGREGLIENGGKIKHPTLNTQELINSDKIPFVNVLSATDGILVDLSNKANFFYQKVESYRGYKNMSVLNQKDFKHDIFYKQTLFGTTTYSNTLFIPTNFVENVNLIELEAMCRIRVTDSNYIYVKANAIVDTVLNRMLGIESKFLGGTVAESYALEIDAKNKGARFNYDTNSKYIYMEISATGSTQAEVSVTATAYSEPV